MSNDSLLQQQSELPEFFKTIYGDRQAINIHNFGSVVPVVQLDIEKTYNGVKVCLVCHKEFDGDNDVRALPCGHPYHGECIYNTVISGNKKQCLCCLKLYV